MNNRQINITFRKAISHAINYSYIIEELTNNTAVRLQSPFPFGMKFVNWSFDYPVFNLTRARQIMQSMGFGIGFNLFDDTEWVNQETTAPFAIYNYTYNIGNNLREGILVLLQDNLAKIGIRVWGAGMSLSDFYNRFFERLTYHRNQLQLYWFSWGTVYYNDPHPYIFQIFSNATIAHLSGNGAQYNGGRGSGGPFLPYGEYPHDPAKDVQLLMEAALHETNLAAREAMYDTIQQLLVERDFPLAWGICDKIIHAHSVDLTGFQQNYLNWLYFYPCEWRPYDYSMVISSPPNITYEVGDTGHSISWTITADPLEDPLYFIYENN
ncbi:MAG: hypothetical protein HWN65_24420, partial [Candidatus Helarchaeota archaeon]|nr:hypothetical protein [Candidatus Helarchaeota archaeon]